VKTEKRIRRHHENLARLTDLREELGSAKLRPLAAPRPRRREVQNSKPEGVQLKASCRRWRWLAMDARQLSASTRVARAGKLAWRP